MNRLNRILFANVGTKIMAVVLASLTWVLMYVRNVTTMDDVDCPVTINLPKGVALLEIEGLKTKTFLRYRSEYVTADFRGSDVALAGLDDVIEAHYTIEQEVQEKTPFRVPTSALSFHVGRNINVSGIRPSSFTISVDRVVERRLEVEVKTVDEPDSGFTVESVRATPNKVRVQGPLSVIGELDKIPTRSVNLSGRKASFDEKGVPLADSLNGVAIYSREVVTVQVTIRQEKEEVEKPVNFHLVVPPNFEYRAELDRDWENCLLKMPVHLAAEPDNVQVRGLVDLEKIDTPKAGETYPLEVELYLPDGVLYEGDPIMVYVTLTKIEGPTE